MRAPLRLAREMGLRSFLVFQLLIAGMLLSALAHPLLIGFVGWSAVEIARGSLSLHSPVQQALFGIDLVNLFGCYLGFLLLARKTMIPEERRRVGRRWAFLPIYWLAISCAAWRAIMELARKPFYWAKTPHVPRATASPSAAKAER